MRSYTITPAVVKARQKQMNIPKRIFILESLEKGWSDETMVREWQELTKTPENPKGICQRHQSFNRIKHAMEDKGQTLEELYKLREELV